MSANVIISADLQRSAVMSTFPWLTDFLVKKSEAVLNNSFFVPFFKSVERFETSLQTPLNELRQALVVIDSSPTEQMPGDVAKLDKLMRSRLCHVLCTYRLVDVLHWLANPAGPSCNPRYSRMQSINVSCDQNTWPMIDWISNLEKGRSIIDSLTGFRNAIDPQALPQSSLEDGLTLQSRLLQDLFEISLHAKGHRMLFNIQVAALHLSILLRGHQEVSSLALPDFLDDPNTLLSGSLSAEGLKHAKGLMHGYSAHKRQFPLYAALLLSPLVLLADKKLLSRCMDQEQMIRVSKALGNCKPPILTSIERALWNTLLLIATGQARAYFAVKTFFSQIPWEEVHAVNENHRKFFAPDVTPSSAPISLLSLETESDIDNSWPLASLRPRKSSETTVADGYNHSSDKGISVGEDELRGIDNEPRGDNRGGDGNEDMDSNEDMGGNENTGGNEGTGGDEDMEISDKEIGHAAEEPGSGGKVMQDADERMEGTDQDRDGGDLAMDGGVAGGRMEVDDVGNRADREMRVGAASGSDRQAPNASSPSNAEAALGRSSRKVRPIVELHRRKAVPAKTAKGRKAKQPKVGATAAALYLQQAGASYFEPVDLDRYTAELQLSFEPEKCRGRSYGKECELFSPSGEQHLFTPEFHFGCDLEGFENFHGYIKKFFVNGSPPHISAPEQSSIHVLTDARFNSLTAQQVQDILETKHIVVTDVPIEEVKFDAKGLQLLTNLGAAIEFQDQSIPVIGGDFFPQLCAGTLRHVLRAAQEEQSAILNALSFPLPLDGMDQTAFSSELEAWRLTEGMKFCTTAAHFPAGDMRWGLAATQGARSWIHIDSDGLGTFVDVKCGYWIMFSPPLTQNKHSFGAIDQFLDDFNADGQEKRWNLESIDDDSWRAEAIHLKAGSRLLMRPNTPHAVFTTDHSIAKGGHFYSTSNLQDTFYAIVHCFIAGQVITNSEHCETRPLLLRMMQYFYKCFVMGAIEPDGNFKTLSMPAEKVTCLRLEYSPGHLPDILKSKSLVDVLTLCNLCCLVNVLDSRTYSFQSLCSDEYPSQRDLDQRERWDYNALKIVDREYFTYVRGLARILIIWVGHHYDIVPSQSEEPVAHFERDFAGAFLMKQAAAILHYKRAAVAGGLSGAAHCTYDALDNQLDLLFVGNEAASLGNWPEVKERYKSYTTLAFGDQTFSVRKKDLGDQFGGMLSSRSLIF